MELISLHENPQHIPTLAQWFHEQWGYLHPGREVEQVIEELKILPNVKGLPFIYVLVEANQVVGTASLITQDMPDYPKAKPWTPWLASVYVDKNYRRQGIGEKLIKAIDQKAIELGFDKIYLFTPDKDAWYEKHGWDFIEKTNYHDDDVVVMSKNLS